MGHTAMPDNCKRSKRRVRRMRETGVTSAT